MDCIHAAPLAFALAIVLTGPASACRDAQYGKPWRPKDAAPVAVVQTIDVATGSKSFLVGAATVDRVHFCVQMASSDPTNQAAVMSLYIWGTKSGENAYLIWIVNGRLSVSHRLFGKAYELVPPTELDATKKRMVELDVKANRDGADVEVDGQPVANIIARPPANARSYGIVFATAPGKPSSFRLGPVLTFGDGN